MSSILEKERRTRRPSIKGRKKKDGPQINKYKMEFIQWLKEKFGFNYEQFYETDTLLEWPNHTRYTDSFKNLQKKIMSRQFGNKIVQKYKEDYISFLQEFFGLEDYLNYLECRCVTFINENFPGNLRYSDYYIRENEKSKKS